MYNIPAPVTIAQSAEVFSENVLKKQTATTAITFVLPFSLSERGENALISRKGKADAGFVELAMSLGSLARNFRDIHTFQIILIVPTRQLAEVKAFIRRFKARLDITLFDESYLLGMDSSLLPDAPSGLTGWYLQQVLKLLASYLVATDFYVTLDSDVVLVRNCAIYDLIRNGRSFVNVETLKDYQNLYTDQFSEHEYSVKARRYASAERLLQYPPTDSISDSFFNETPVILHTKSVRDLLVRLDKVFGGNTLCKLMRTDGWTEYALYFSFMRHENRLDEYHTRSPMDFVVDLAGSAYQKSKHYRNPRNYTVDAICLNESTRGRFFLVFQSWIDPAEWIKPFYDSKIDFYRALATKLGLQEVLDYYAEL